MIMSMGMKRKMSRILALAAAIGCIGVFSALPALAQVDLGLEYATATGLSTTDIRTTIGNVIKVFLGLLGIIAVIIILLGGFKWMTAGGDAAKVERAKKTLINGVLGLVIIISAYAITAFIIRAIIGEQGVSGYGPGVCPPGQVCGGIIPGGAGAFRVDGISPSGPGPNDIGWPKNYALTAVFNSDVNAATVSADTVEVRKCNPRTSGGDPQPFNEGSCAEVISGMLFLDGRRVAFRPDASPEDDPTYFEGEYWYLIVLQGGEIRDIRGRVLACPIHPPGDAGDISSPLARSDLCEMAVAFSDQVDLTPPDAVMYSPKSPPAYCAQTLPVQVRAEDDYLVSRIDYLLNGSVEGLVDEMGVPLATSTNSGMNNPYRPDDVYVDTSNLSRGEQYSVTATPHDGVPQAGEPALSEFILNPAHCCNGELDLDQGETGIDCGPDSGCGLCAGANCSDDADCQSGYCDPATNTCVERPIIDSVSPNAGGPGTFVTVRGRFFGSPGGVVFMGDRLDDNDDVQAPACVSEAWSCDPEMGTCEVVVSVPDGARDGPLKLVSASGKYDDTTEDTAGWVGDFNVTDTTLPGICYVSPGAGSAGSDFTIHGSGFQGTIGNSFAKMGTNDIAVKTWTDTEITSIAPAIRDGAYPVKVWVGGWNGLETNTANFVIRPMRGDAGPVIMELLSADGPVGSYVTIRGSGFGTRKGIVRLYDGAVDPDSDLVTCGSGEPPACETVCEDNWHDNYITIKLPDSFDSGENILAPRSLQVQVETSAPARTSNTKPFTVGTGVPMPGMCSISPDNGPVGTFTQISGENFGDDGDPGQHSVEFYTSGVQGGTPPLSTTGMAHIYWAAGTVSGPVPGVVTDDSTWPNTGPVYVVAENAWSSNPIPFTVRNCNESDPACEDPNLTCCPSGACMESCEPQERDSAYGWIFSTETLPELPTVVERAQCTNEELQSPSPFRRSRDACINTKGHVEFTSFMEMEGGDCNDLVVVGECGTGETPVCTGEAAVSVTCSLYGADGGSNLDYFFSALSQGTWYRVTLVSDPVSGAGFAEQLTSRYLDGDYDRIQGGNYEYTFRTRESDIACELDRVVVTPSRYTIDNDHDPFVPGDPEPGFNASLLAANCNPIACEIGAVPQYYIDWKTGDPSVLTLDDPAYGACLERMPVWAMEETAENETVGLNASANRIGSDLYRESTADIKVKFADPYVVRKAPDCLDACVNGKIWTEFNVAMDANTLTESNFSLYRCRNASCNPPYDISLQPKLNDVISEDPKMASLDFEGDLAPSTFYRVVLRGGDHGIKSASGVPLTKLNYGDNDRYSWTFRTKDDGTPCAVNRARIVPETVQLYFVGQRTGLTVTPYGAPDECDSRGQALSADEYDWDWSYDDNGVIEGFVSAGQVSAVYSDPAILDTSPSMHKGCSAGCLLLGSMPGVPQCGNGRIDRGEACEQGQENCLPSCIWLGTSGVSEGGTCGDGEIQGARGEECDMVESAGTGEPEWPPGCTQPAGGERGCIWKGSSGVPNSRCGNGLIEDGENCDDGNVSNGDGCSADCLLEGTLMSCNVSGEPCVNECGNGEIESGEACDGGVGCSIGTCLHTGTQKCSSTGGAAPCCGNGSIESGEECDELDAAGDLVPWCSDRCLLAGSFYGYAAPSFCGDGRVGAGEVAQCEAGATPDGNVDPLQAIEAGKPRNADTATSIVTATLPEIGSDSGTSEVTLSCVCDEADDPQGYCRDIGDRQDPSVSLGCASDGCCAVPPGIVHENDFPGNTNDVCRNTAIRVEFDQPMDTASVSRGFLVGEQAFGPGECAQKGWQVLSYSQEEARGTSSHISILRRIWGGLKDLFRGIFGRIVSAFAPAPYDGDATFCVVPGTVSMAGTTATFAVDQALKEDTWYKVVVKGGPDGVRAANGVPMAENDGFYFGTGTDICKIDYVSIRPGRHLFTTSEDLGTGTDGDALDGDHEFVARAHPKGRDADAEIVTTEHYSFKWRWDDQVENSVVTLNKTATGPIGGNGFCEAGEDPSDPAVTDCNIDLSAAASPKPEPGVENKVCEPEETAADTFACEVIPAESAVATVGVRRIGDGFPHDGEAVVRVTADIVERGVNHSSVSATSDVTVLLCENPWPARRTCDSQGRVSPSMPWDYPASGDSGFCSPENAAYWSPFYDPGTNVSFYYCRDGVGGDQADLLPDIDETEIIMLEPGSDVLREYIFPMTGGDAVGFRISKNLGHLSARAWYDTQGFFGSPSPVEVSGYEALREGRTVYVNSGAVADNNMIYTNVNVLSYSDNAAPETVAVYGQILDNLDLNTNMSDLGYCMNGVYGQWRFDPDCTSDICRWVGGWNFETGTPISCSFDAECARTILETVGSDDYHLGEDILLNGGVVFCAAPEAKLKRDVKRWGELQEARIRILEGGNYPKLESGTYLRARSVSTWDSWNAALASGLGFSLPKDPVNEYSYCPVRSGYSEDECWDADNQRYMCPTLSYVYGYTSVGGTDFSLSADTETSSICQTGWMDRVGCEVYSPICAWQGGSCQQSAFWGGITCPEMKTSSDCNNAGKVCSNDALRRCSADSDCYGEGATCVMECAWVASGSGGYCDYRTGGLKLGGVQSGVRQCGGRVEGIGGTCGDGIVQADRGEECEPGVTLQPEECTRFGSTGVKEVTCNESCRKVYSQCETGYCGDGVVQYPEKCDDGGLNGTYGYCDKNCGGSSFRCGDDEVQPPEACDCGERNGIYRKKGVMQVGGAECTNTNNYICAWDCSGIGPHCGDGIVDTSEQCDGNFQESKGYCSDDDQSPCDTTEDCPLKPDGSRYGCGHFCPTAEEINRRDCKTGRNKCKWHDWNCVGAGECGNGIMETGEECDDGATDSKNADAGECVIDSLNDRLCKMNVCGDGYVNAAGGEQCDEGSGNGLECVPLYGQTCNYCTTTCRIGTKSGGYCGDGRLQNKNALPPGPEECELATGEGLGSNWICVMTDIPYKSWGISAGPATCEPEDCTKTCSAPGAAVCDNTGWINTDADGDGEHHYNWEDYGQAWFSWDEVALWNLNADRHLMDVCDPDKDGDGLPDENDCGILDHRIHQEYTMSYTDSLGVDHDMTIPPHSEDCDGVDNDCNGLIDNIIRASGTVIDPQTGRGLELAVARVMCGGTGDDDHIAFEIPLDPDGYFEINHYADISQCQADGKFYVMIARTDGQNLCNATKEYTFTGGGCINKQDINFDSVTLNPPPGGVRMTIRWSADVDLDLHMYSSEGDHVFYGKRSIDDEGYLYSLDVDDRGSHSGGYDPGGMETITIARKPGLEYFTYIHDYPRGADWEDYGLEMRMWFDDCSVHKRTPSHVDYHDPDGRPWIAFYKSCDVAGGDKYCRSGIPNTCCDGACTMTNRCPEYCESISSDTVPRCVNAVDVRL